MWKTTPVDLELKDVTNPVLSCMYLLMKIHGVMFKIGRIISWDKYI